MGAWPSGASAAVPQPELTRAVQQDARSSARLALTEVFAVLPIASVVQVGGKDAAWLSAAIALGASRAMAVGNDHADRRDLPGQGVQLEPCDLEIQDFRAALGGSAAFDIAICVDAAERLPASRAAAFVAQLCCLSDLIVFSAAIPGQDKTRNRNEQWPGYWAKLFSDNDFACFDPLRLRLWSDPDCEWQYSQSLLLYARSGTAAWRFASLRHPPTAGSPLPLIHPNMLPHAIRCASDGIAAQLALHHPFTHDGRVHLLEVKLDHLRALAAEKDGEITALKRLVGQVTAALELARGTQATLIAERDRLLRYTAVDRSRSKRRLLRQLITLFRP